MDSKKWTICTVAVCFVLVLAIAATVAVVDPYFHFHAPIEGVPYAFSEERYQNNGIIRFFDYDAVITGTSMTENFKPSEFDQLFGTNTVKFSYSGGTFKEISDSLRLAFSTHENIRYVLFGLDTYCLEAGKDQMKYGSYPDYLYDDDVFNDINYVLNVKPLYDVMPTVRNILSGGRMTSFDEYANWMGLGSIGKQFVLKGYQRPEESPPVPFTQEDRTKLAENLQQNIISLAQEHPETEFYLFFPPYSVLSWDELARQGKMDRYFQMEEYTVDCLLTCRNIHVFSFCDDFEVTTDLDLYRDIFHYVEDVNSRMLQCMKDGRHEITADNYPDYQARVKAFYTQYDYDGLLA